MSNELKHSNNQETVASRRSFLGKIRTSVLAGALGAPLPTMTALASVPAIAGGVSGSTVMAAIESHKRAFAALEEADDQLYDFEQELPCEVTRLPRVQVGGGWFDGKEYDPIWAYCPADIDHATGHIAFWTSPEKMEERRALLHAEYWADVDTMNELRQSSGLSNMRELAEIAAEKESAALDELLSVEVQSLEESRALAGYLHKFLESTDVRPWILVEQCFLALAGSQSNESRLQARNALETA